MSIKGNAASFQNITGSVSFPDVIRGKSAYEIAVMNGFEGTEKEWLATLKGETGKGEKGDSPVRGVDYWTTEDREAIEQIVLDKSSMIGGFVPVASPVWESGIKPKNTLAKITAIGEADGKCIVTFNENEELFTDGSLESYNAGTSLVLLNNNSKNEYGWSGINFDGASTRYARIESSATSHSGNKVLKVRSPYSSLWKSLKLKPNTAYTLSFWSKGAEGDHFSNIVIAGRAAEGDVHYANSGGAFICDKNAPDYRILYDVWYHAGDAGECFEMANTWQKFSVNFSTCDEEYVDICIYFGTSRGDFYFDDFSIKEVLGEVFTASYDADKVQGYDWLKVGSYFLVDCHSTHFSRFEYASSLAIVKLYRHVAEASKTAYQYAVEGGYTGTEAEFTRRIAMSSTYNVAVPLSWITSDSGVYQTISLNGVTEDDIPVVDVLLGDDHDANALYLDAWSKVSRVETSNNAITVYCYEAPTTAFTMQVKAVV